MNIQTEGRFAGPHQQMMDLGLSIQKFGVQTKLVFPIQDSEIFQRKLKNSKLQYSAIALHRLSKHPISLLQYILFFFKDIRTIKNEIKVYNPDIVQCNGSWQFKGVLASRSLGIPVVWHLTDTLMPRLIRLIFDRVKKNYVHHFISASKKGASYYLNQKSKSENIWVIQSPVQTDYFDPNTTQSNDLWTKDERAFKVITVGNITPVKGYERLLQIAEMLQDRGVNDVKFVIIGRIWESQKRYYKELQEGIESRQLVNVDIIPGSDDIKAWLGGADIYFCSSNSEASPIAVWEALSMALPVVSTDVGDVKELVEGHNAGFVHGHDALDDIVNSILQLKQNHSLRERMSAHARKLALTEFNSDSIARKHLEVYKAVLNDAID